MKSYSLIRYLALGALCSTLPLSLTAATIFDNSVHDLSTRLNPGTTEVGDEILLAGSERYLTNFSFEYWGTNTAAAGNTPFSGSVEARVRFYENNGLLFNGYSAPGTSFYDSGWFSIGSPTARNTFEFRPGADGIPTAGLFVPVSDMTWSVQFRGLGATDQAGVDLYSPSTVGQDFPDYWQFSGGSWELMTNSVSMDFGALFEASLTGVPEPSTLALLGLGGLTLLAAVRRTRRAG
jgi:hypothetical protein